MNVHHLELFYYVAKHEGITEAVRRMPYGIQQPAVSGQMLNLENELGVKLFQRRPFVLTPAGEELYGFVYPFFSRMDEIRSRVRGEGVEHLRLAASTAVLANHLPNVLEKMKEEFPSLRLTLREAHSPSAETALLRREADIAVSLLHGRLPSGIRSEKLIEAPLILLAPASWEPKTFEKICEPAFKGDFQINEPLISLLPDETIARLFQTGISNLGLCWQPQMEVTTLELVRSYVEKGLGYGVSVAIPAVPLPDSVRAIPLDGFSPLVLGLLSLGDLPPPAEKFREAAIHYAMQLAEEGKKKLSAQAKKKAASVPTKRKKPRKKG